MKIEFKIFICVKIMNIKILILLIKNYRNKIIYCAPEPNSSGGLIKSGSIVELFQGPTDN